MLMISSIQNTALVLMDMSSAVSGGHLSTTSFESLLDCIKQKMPDFTARLNDFIVDCFI